MRRYMTQKRQRSERKEYLFYDLWILFILLFDSIKDKTHKHILTLSLEIFRIVFIFVVVARISVEGLPSKRNDFGRKGQSLTY